jgi:hypothetical protein
MEVPGGENAKKLRENRWVALVSARPGEEATGSDVDAIGDSREAPFPFDTRKNDGFHQVELL